MNPALRHRDGTVTQLPLARWHAPASLGERGLLATLSGPVVDIGCGPGRLAIALAEAGVAALGVDSSPEAVAHTLRGGAAALCRSIFDTLPGEGRWRSALLFDGNVGIGGDPRRMLGRVVELLAPGGAALVEAAQNDDPLTVREVRLEVGQHVGPWFRWASVGPNALESLAGAAGLVVTSWHGVEGRPIARLAAVRA